ncbi:F-box domain-containing protein [Mycena indigotica]|uniref:F-box domain-containing protein n=1 Tax=Mycena indigotica TaxID=2126181 RepID=A0A8H6SQJ2_9AGAR|nr:F-box domain-containing protein [Mycena indigotica]KAF7302125.1 F-box domain-containing protein [Mycena indigotica]
MRVVARETEHSPVPTTSFDKLSHDVLLMIFEQFPYDECLKLATLSRRLRAVLLPVIYRRLGWAPGLVDFPPRRILPFTRVFTLAGHNIRSFTSAQHATIASQFRDAFPIMKSLHTFILGGNVADGLWSELLDAFAVLSNPIDLIVHAPWQPDDDEEEPIKLEPRTTTLPLRRFSFTVPFIFDVLDREMARRLPDVLKLEIQNIRVILAASVPTMAQVEIPGELISALDGPVWTSLTELYLNGLWPTFDGAEGKFPDVGPSLEHTSSTPLGVVAWTSSIESSDAAKDPSVPTEGPPPSPAISKAENEPNPVHVPELPDTFTSTSKVMESSSTPSLTTTANPPENASHQPPSTSSTKASLILSILERMPNLRLLNMMLVFQKADGPESELPICRPDRSPSLPFLQRLTQFQATCLPNDDRIIDFLPPSLELLSLRRYPLSLEDGMRRVWVTPETLLNLLKRAELPNLTTLRFWYLIGSKEELEHEKPLLDLLPKLFPLVQHLEFSRKWDHFSPMLEGCQWDPMPIVCDFFSRFKHLKSILFDASLPERYGWPPESYPSSDFRQMVGRLHGMAGEIVNAAPWVKSIGMYRAFGSDEDLYWEVWDVVSAPEGKVALDRPPPPIVDSIFYP